MPSLVWEPQGVSLSPPSLRPARWISNGGPSLAWEPQGVGLSPLPPHPAG